MIQVENLTEYYGDLAAIKDVSFNVSPVEVCRHIQHYLFALDRRGGPCVCLVAQKVGSVARNVNRGTDTRRENLTQFK
jgi:hypothetical protein